ncbi:MAG: recombinase family protein, partial [Pseudomonadota bacterium]
FDANEVSFVSVTQSFNTTSSMGRLTLNVLLSFAQFEREVTGERIRDKIAASKRKGMWMGGNAPLGYLPKDRSLVIDEPQAQRVREMYRLYLALGNVRLLKAEVERLGWLTPERKTRRLDAMGKRPFSRGHLYRILSNPIYVGRIPHKDTSYEGNHPAIIDLQTWEAVQHLLASNIQGQRTASRATQPSLLIGRLVDDEGLRLTPSHAKKGARRYRYYVREDSDGDSTRTPLRVPAHELEELVCTAVVAFLRDGRRLMALMGQVDADVAQRRIAEAAALASRLEGLPPAELVEPLVALIGRVTLGTHRLEVSVRSSGIWPGQPCAADVAEDALVEVPVQLKRCGMAVRMVVPGLDAPVAGKVDPRMVALLVKAQNWFSRLSTGQCKTVREIAQAEGITGSLTTRVMYLAFLAPDIVQRIARGEHPLTLDSTRLLKAVPLPCDWKEQRTLLGFAAERPSHP